MTNFLQTFQNDYENDNISAAKLFISKYNKLFHVFRYYIDIDFKTILDFIKKKFNQTELDILFSRHDASLKNNKKLNVDNNYYLIELEEELFCEIKNELICFYFADPIKKTEIQNIAKEIVAKPKKKKHSNNFYMMITSKYSVSGFDLKKFKVKEVTVNIEDNYNNDFPKIDKKISDFISDNKRNGIIMLHGKFGTGKSTYIRHLLQKTNKRFIYLPLHLISGLSSPDLVNFFASYKNSVIILEDCEEIIKPRSTSNQSTEALVNLLNLGDGLLSDAFSVKLICTFNAELKKIDPAILRKGRLAIRYEFMPLEIDKAQKLAQKLKIDTEITEPTTLADIFNTNQVAEEYEKTKRLGF
ncbi:MAG: AAA family ATPase [Bacteroidales bacterium]|nr:AAA family ATPase [Bacteroidales bacterium]